MGGISHRSAASSCRAVMGNTHGFGLLTAVSCKLAHWVIKKAYKKIRVFAPNKPKVYVYKLIESYPHDINAYTQGLEFVNGILFESTGQYGKSSLRKVNFKTWEVIQKLPIDEAYFAEGITHFDNKIIQLIYEVISFRICCKRWYFIKISWFTNSSINFVS